jgi:hypothetical protein
MPFIPVLRVSAWNWKESDETPERRRRRDRYIVSYIMLSQLARFSCVTCVWCVGRELLAQCSTEFGSSCQFGLDMDSGRFRF